MPFKDSHAENYPGRPPVVDPEEKGLVALTHYGRGRHGGLRTSLPVDVTEGRLDSTVHNILVLEGLKGF